MFKRFALAAALFAFGPAAVYGASSPAPTFRQRSSPKHLCRRSFQRKARPRRTAQRTLLYGSTFPAASTITKASAGMDARSTALMLARRTPLRLVIARARMGSDFLT